MMPAALGLSPDVGGFKTIQEELAYYKAQYEHLESELLEFQASSRELEAELEKDVEASEKRERALKKTVETLSYEVEEWKVSDAIAAAQEIYEWLTSACSEQA